MGRSRLPVDNGLDNFISLHRRWPRSYFVSFVFSLVSSLSTKSSKYSRNNQAQNNVKKHLAPCSHPVMQRQVCKNRTLVSCVHAASPGREDYYCCWFLSRGSPLWPAGMLVTMTISSQGGKYEFMTYFLWLQ